MVDLTVVRTSNASFTADTINIHKVAVFIGATSGIGLATLYAFVKSSIRSSVYIVGRSRETFSTHLTRLQESNTTIELTFIEAEIALIKEVDRVCNVIKGKEETIDLLWLSCGKLMLGDRKETSEGLYIPLALSYFSRQRFIYNLLLRLEKSSDPRVVSILGGGLEKGFDIDDIEVKNDFSAVKAAQTATPLTTLAMDELSSAHPKVTFIHKYPGFVNTGSVTSLFSQTSGLLYIPFTILNYTLLPLLNAFVATTPAESGERGLYLLTSPTFKAEPSAHQSAENSMATKTVFILGPKDDPSPETKELRGYREEAISTRVWNDTQNVWKRCLGTEE